MPRINSILIVSVLVLMLPSAGWAEDREAKGRDFWAFQHPRKSTPPQVKNQTWPRGDIDRFILARLEAAGLEPTKEADRETLLRRIYFDLVGLPPTIQQIDDFLNDKSSDATAKVVDQLLDSPQFGERWSRHWLDVARYADSTGGGRSLLLPNAWRYRDYVVDSFNRDKPFDQFIREQVAGDLLRAENDAQRPEQLIATSFLMIGAHNYELQDKEQLRMDVVDEQIEAIGRAFLAQTLGCARCHDHKFDPIPTKDYYALAGIFRSTKSLTPGNVSGFEQHELPVSPERRAALDKHAAAVKTVQTELDAAKAQLKKLQAELKVAGGSKGASTTEQLLGIVVDDADAKVVGNWTKSKYNPGYVGEGYIHDGASGKGEKSITFHVDLPQAGMYEVRISYTHGNNRSPSLPITVRHEDDEDTIQIDEREPPPIDKRFISLGRWQFKKGGQDAIHISNAGTTAHVIVDAIQFIPVEMLDTNPKRERGSDVVRGEDQKKDSPQSPQSNADSEDSRRASVASAVKEMDSKVKLREADLKKLKDGAPDPPPMTMGVKDEKEPGDFRVCVRGIVHNLGDEVRRGFVAIASTPDADPPAISSGQSGRRELAEWLAGPTNPLTVRVTVNRIWHHLFGVGLVRTTDNFGSTGETPSHPELLDWLAHRFVELGWSHKNLIREIVLSRTYQLSSALECGDLSPLSSVNDGSSPRSKPSTQPNFEVDSESGDPGAPGPHSKTDPDNRLLSHQNRKRLDAECLRDAMLAVSGKLDLTRGGPTIREKTQSEYGYVFDPNRRSIYLPVFRNNLPDIFEVFDFADPNTPTGRRNVSTLPAQALYLMNSPFVMDQARHAADDILELDQPDTDRIDLAYRRTVGRLPTDTERALAIGYISSFKPTKPTDPTDQRLQAWTRFYQTLFASLDFRYVH